MCVPIETERLLGVERDKSGNVEVTLIRAGNAGDESLT